MTERIVGNPQTSLVAESGPSGRVAPICLGCNKPILNRRKGVQYHNKNCRRLAKPEKRIRPFVALDGEGETLKSGEHIYTLLAASTGQWVGTKKGLSTEQCLDFLLNLPRGNNDTQKPIYVWFAFDYDVNMMLGDIPLKGDNSIETLRRTNQVYWRGYSISYIRRKIFRVSYGGRTHTSYDVWGFFQSSFESSLTSWGIENSDTITEGKAARSSFHNWTLGKIREYNQSELVSLVELCEKLRAAIDPLHLPITSWHGPAALASAWLRSKKVFDWIKDVPPDLFEISTRAYFGGRIDVLGYGFVSPVWHYDIISAYPASTTKLPRLTNLTWKRHGKGWPKLGELYVARIKWDIPSTYWAPFPWRAHNGSIRYPLEGEGWYWYPEIEAAIERYGKRYFKCVEAWIAEPIAGTEIEYPFARTIPDLFAYRKTLKQESNPSHVAVKLILNSLYGKFAQTVGKARYYSPVWAGLITSHTRAKLMRAITDSVVCVMTDSLWSMEPLDLELGDGLGDWEYQSEQSLCLAEAGLYQGISSTGDIHVWQRGFDKRNPVDIPSMVSEWLSGNHTYSPTYSVTRFVGMGLASVTSYPWRRWVEIDRRIESVPLWGTTKRFPFPVRIDDRIVETESGTHFVPLDLLPRDDDNISYPYSKVILDPKISEYRLQDEADDQE